MNREILFRGKRFDNGEWVEGFYVYRPDGKHLIYWKPFDDAKQNTYHIVTPETVGQFTGLTDKNGKRIFEGDIIKWVGSTDSFRGIEFSNQVYWLKYRWRVKGTHNNKTFHTNLSSSQVYNHEIEVIGNIHDKTKQP